MSDYLADGERRPEETDAQYWLRVCRGNAWHKVVRTLGSRYSDCTLDNYRVYDDAQKPVLERCREIAANIVEFIKSRRWILFHGYPGTGKDHMLAALLREACTQSPLLPGQSAYELAWADGHTARAHKEFPESPDVNKSHVLAISDPVNPVGKTPDWEIAQLLKVLDSRYRNRRPVWLTCNALTLDQAEAQFGTPAFERIIDDCEIVNFAWPSYRRRNL